MFIKYREGGIELDLSNKRVKLRFMWIHQLSKSRYWCWLNRGGLFRVEGARLIHFHGGVETQRITTTTTKRESKREWKNIYTSIPNPISCIFIDSSILCRVYNTLFSQTRLHRVCKGIVGHLSDTFTFPIRPFCWRRNTRVGSDITWLLKWAHPKQVEQDKFCRCHRSYFRKDKLINPFFTPTIRSG